MFSIAIDIIRFLILRLYCRLCDLRSCCRCWSCCISEVQIETTSKILHSRSNNEFPILSMYFMYNCIHFSIASQNKFQEDPSQSLATVENSGTSEEKFEKATYAGEVFNSIVI